MIGVNIPKKRGLAKSVVGESIDVLMKRKVAHGIVEAAAVVKEERAGSKACVVRAISLEGKCSSANSGVRTALGVAKERKRANC
jgi:hypothetical protein